MLEKIYTDLKICECVFVFYKKVYNHFTTAIKYYEQKEIKGGNYAFLNDILEPPYLKGVSIWCLKEICSSMHYNSPGSSDSFYLTISLN